MYRDRVWEGATVDGTNDIVLSGVAQDGGYVTYGSRFTDGRTVEYTIVSKTNPATEWEVGEGVYVAATNRIQRVRVLDNSLGTTVKVAFTPGEADVFNNLPAKHAMTRAKQAFLAGG